MPATPPNSRSFKILMLHGYTQNGELFHAKTRVLEKHLQKAFPGVSLSYPTGPLKLNPAEVPGFDVSNNNDPDDLEAYGWWRRADHSSPPEYVHMEKGLAIVSEVLQREGPFDGVIGFSQGAALAAMTSSLLEKDRRQAFTNAQSNSQYAMPYPSSFESLDHPPLKFCISYCGFVAPGDRYQAFYNPVIQTPVCHFIGSLDSVVEESRTQALVNATGGLEKTQIVTHPGGHFVPSGRQFLDAVVVFLRQILSNQKNVQEQTEARAEDMDVPF